VAPDDIDYDGDRIDAQSQIIIQLLRDMGGEATAGKLRSETGLDDTSSVHHRVREHLGPSAADLIERTGRAERPGGQSDEVIYALTDEGLDFAVAHDNELTDAVAAAEAVDTLRRIRATVDGFEARVTDVEGSVENMDAWKNRWSTRVGEIEDNVDEIGSEVDGKADAEWVEENFREWEKWDETRRESIEDLAGRVDGIEDALATVRGRLDEIAEKLEERPTTDEVIEAGEAMREDLEEKIEDAKGLF
jgi:vacuolar-type H+-ATPase subunit I/STV1